MCRAASIVLVFVFFVTVGCGAAASKNQSPVASDEEVIQSQEEIARREAQAQADEADFFRRKERP